VSFCLSASSDLFLEKLTCVFIFHSTLVKKSWKSARMKSVLIIVLFSFIKSGLGCNGCLALDELTFDKVVKKFTTVLVKFDQMFPFGDTHDAYSTLSFEINNKSISGYDHKDLIVATVGIKDYGEFDNKALGEKYGRSTAIKMDSPVIKLFNDGDLDNPIGLEIGKIT
jgi:hypothetical protein